MAITILITPSTTTLATSVGGVSTFTLTDNSTYSSPSRASVGVYLSTYKTDYAGNNLIATSVSNNLNPATDSIWTVNYGSDGWYQSYYVAIPNYTAGTYNLYDCAYIAANKTTWQSTIAANSNALTGTGGTGWIQLSDPTQLVKNIGLTNQSNNITSGIVNFIQYPTTEQQAGLQVSTAFLEESTTAFRNKDVRSYNMVTLALNGMKYAANAGNYGQAEIYARRIAQFYI